MTRTASTMVELGTLAPQFSLHDVTTGKKITLPKPNEAKATVVMFICNHCPFVKHVNKELTRLANDYMAKGICFIAISANDPEDYPDDSPDNMRITAQKESYPFPYLFDETQEVAKTFQAACTPDFFIYSSTLELVYRGQLDDSRPGNNIPVSGSSIRNVLDDLLSGMPVTTLQKPSLGCNIKWRD